MAKLDKKVFFDAKEASKFSLDLLKKGYGTVRSYKQEDGGHRVEFSEKKTRGKGPTIIRW